MTDPSVQSAVFAFILILGLIFCGTFLYQVFTGRFRRVMVGAYMLVMTGVLFAAIVLILRRTGVEDDKGTVYLALYVIPHVCAMLIFFFRYRQSDREYKDNKKTAAQYAYALELLINERKELEETIEQTLAGLDDSKPDDAAPQGGELLRKLDKVRSVSMLEAVVHAKEKICADSGIDFSVETSGTVSRLDSIETVSLFGNILDNAIEACVASGAEHPYIKGSVTAAANIISIDIANSKRPEPAFRGGRLRTTKKDAASHGFGTKQIASIAAKHNGTVEMTDGGDEFRLRAVLELPAESVPSGGA